ncbi:Putative mitochondrial protein, partial [Glycine soja]
LIFTGNNPNLFEDFKESMSREFDMTDMGLMSYYLGMEVKQTENGIFVSQERYTKEVLKKFNMLDCNPMNTPMEGGLKLSKFDEGEKVDSTIFKSLVGSLRKSTTGFVFFMGDCVFTWSSKKQGIVTLSTCEAEYVAATSCTCHVIWLKRLLEEFQLLQKESTKIYVDNRSAQELAK